MLAYLLSTFLLFGGISCLRWNSSGLGSPVETMILLQLTSSGPKIDVSAGEQIIIVKDVRTYASPITILCFISGYNDNSVIEYTFCKNADCTAKYKDGDSTSGISLYGVTVNIETRFPGQKGIKIEMMIPSDQDASGDFYCQVSDNFGHFMIRSNNIQIRDRIYWEQNLISTANNVKTTLQPEVLRNSVPVIYDCMAGGLTLNPNRPKWTNQEFVHPTQWSVCPIKNNFQSLTAKDKMTFTKCVDYTKLIWPSELDVDLKPKDASEMTIWKLIINPDGQLVIFNLELSSTLPEYSYALMCYFNRMNTAVPITTYIQDYAEDNIKVGVVFNATMVTYKTKLTNVSPLVQSINIYSRKVPDALKLSSVPRVAIYALYKASSEVTTNWMYNDGQLSSGSEITFDKYKVEFVRNIKSSMAGVYTLIVTDGPEQLRMVINVTVLGPPTLENPDCLPLIRHVWEGDQTQFSCNYKDRPSVLKLKINAEEIQLNNGLPISQGILQKSYPYLEKLNFTISPSTFSESDKVTMTYTVYNLRKTIGQTVYQDHTIMFFVQNSFGLSVKSTSIYTVPKVELLITSSPEKYNCTVACSSSARHDFQCRITTSVYDNKELIVDHYWTINGHRLEETTNLKNPFAQYFIVNPTTKDLTMLPITSNNTVNDKFVKDTLRSNVIQCNLDLKSTPDSVPRFMFITANDPKLMKSLQARITLDYIGINTAYIYWVIAVILAIVILIILIVLLTRYCMRNKGETYALDKIERKHGYDPEKEVQEEMFKPYERQEHDPEVLSDGSRRLSISAHSIGSADDGELDNYALDPSNFNEDGSIIGKYGANPRNRAEAT